MADFESIIRNHVGEDGNIPTTAINAIVTAIKQAVGNEYVDKERYKAKLTEIDALKEAQQTAEDNATTAEKWKTKYESLKAETDNFKANLKKKEVYDSKEKAYRGMLKEVGVSDSHIDAVLKVSKEVIDGIEFDDGGKIKGLDELTENARNEWSGFIVSTETRGANTPNPPTVTGNTMTKEDIMKIKDTTKRQQAIAQNINLFKKG